MRELENQEIEDSVRGSLKIMQDLLNNKPIDMDRQPNEENKLYLKLMEFAELRTKKLEDPFQTYTSSDKKILTTPLSLR